MDPLLLITHLGAAIGGVIDAAVLDAKARTADGDDLISVQVIHW